jgi:signal transduction histidine kinase
MRRQLQAQQRFTWTVEHSSDGFVWLDQELRMAGCNAAAGRWLGLGDRMLDGADVPLPSLLNERFRIRPRIDWLELSATREAHEITLVRPESPIAAAQWLRLTLSPLPAAPGDTVRWMAHLEDVTALQNTMGQAVSLLGLMNHKLRTPLAMVRTPIELLTQGYMGTDDPDWPKFRDQLDAAISRLQRDVDQLLRMADLMERPLISAGEPIGDRVTFERVAREAAMDIGIAATSLSLRCEGERMPRMGVEALQLVLMQLFGNALKFHPERAPLITLKLEPWDDHQVRLEVEDDGPGIPEELQEQVWQPMYQIDRVGAGEVPGAGIGLSLVANIAWRLGGRCWIESTSPGEASGGEPSDAKASAKAAPRQAHGTRVCLLLPAADGNVPEPS